MHLGIGCMGLSSMHAPYCKASHKEVRWQRGLGKGHEHEALSCCYPRLCRAVTPVPMLCREVQLLQACNHPHVVKLLEAYQSQSGRLYLVFEVGGMRKEEREREMPLRLLVCQHWTLRSACSTLPAQRRGANQTLI